MPARKRILVAEAERHIAHLVQVNLSRAGYQVINARDGDEALRKAQSERPDLIALGSLAAPTDAAEVRERLRANEATKDIPVVPLAAGPDAADIFCRWRSGH